MKILCVIDSIGSGGAQRQLVELAISFKQLGHDISFLTYHPASFYAETLNREGIPYSCIEEVSYFKRMLKMRSFIRKGGFDSVLSFLEAANFICEVSGFPFRKWKLVVGERSANPNILKSKKLRLYRWMHFFADFVVANSNENIKMVQMINPFLSKKKYRVIYNMLDLNKWSPSNEYRPLQNGVLRIVIAASLQRVKNLKGLVEGVNSLEAADRERLIIEWYGDVAPDSSFNEAKDLIAKYGIMDNFLFYPATLEILEKMRHADVVALFSHYEGLPNAICEGMAIGKPIIATNISDLSALVSTDNGILCDSHDPKTITAAIKKFLDADVDLFRTMGDNSRSLAKTLFDRESITKAYKEILIDN